MPAERHGGGQGRENGGDELLFPSAVSEKAGWHEPMCDRQCGKEVCKFYGIASVMVEDTESRTQYISP